MGVIQRQITGESIYEGIKLNGVPLIRERWFTFDYEGKPTAACILGIASLNLHIAANEDYTKNIGDSLQAQLNRYEINKDSHWWTNTGNNNHIADLIIYWFDKRLDTLYGGKPVYYLSTEESVLEMVREILDPVWNTTFIVDSYEF